VVFTDKEKRELRLYFALKTISKLSYDPVMLFLGDSQVRGPLDSTQQTAAINSYTVTNKIQTLNASGNFVTYTPGTITGIDNGNNNGYVGPEMAYIKQFLVNYPNNTLYLIKRAESGSYQTRGVSYGTASVTSPGNNTVTVNSGTINSNSLLVGSGIETGVYFPFTGFLSAVGLAGGRVGPAFSNVTANLYNGTISWSSTEGLTYNGNSGNTNNGVRALIISAISSLISAGKTPVVYGLAYILGTNDMGNSTTAAAFQTDMQTFITRIKSDLPLSTTKIVVVRPGTGSVGSTQVRSAMQSVVGANPNMSMIDTDSYNRYDGTHWDITGLNAIGDNIFNIVHKNGVGI
jgi:hypothetical protein